MKLNDLEPQSPKIEKFIKLLNKYGIECRPHCDGFILESTIYIQSLSVSCSQKKVVYFDKDKKYVGLSESEDAVPFDGIVSTGLCFGPLMFDGNNYYAVSTSLLPIATIKQKNEMVSILLGAISTNQIILRHSSEESNWPESLHKQLDELEEEQSSLMICVPF